MMILFSLALATLAASGSGDETAGPVAESALPNLEYECLVTQCRAYLRDEQCRSRCRELDFGPSNNPQAPVDCPEALKTINGISECVQKRHPECTETNRVEFRCEEATTTSTLPPRDPACMIKRCQESIKASAITNVMDDYCKDRCSDYMYEDHQNYKSEYWCPEADWSPRGFTQCVVDHFPKCALKDVYIEDCPLRLSTTTPKPYTPPNRTYECMLKNCQAWLKDEKCKTYCSEIDCGPPNNPQSPTDCPKALLEQSAMPGCVMKKHPECTQTTGLGYWCAEATTTSTTPPKDPECIIDRCKQMIIPKPSSGIKDEWVCQRRCDEYYLKDHQNYNSEFWCPEATWDPRGYTKCVINYFKDCDIRQGSKIEPCPVPQPFIPSPDPRPDLEHECLVSQCRAYLRDETCRSHCREIDFGPPNNPQAPLDCPVALKTLNGIGDCVQKRYPHCTEINRVAFRCEEATTTSTRSPRQRSCMIERCEEAITAKPSSDNVSNEWCKSKCSWYMDQDHWNYKSDLWCPEAKWNHQGFIQCVVNYFPQCEQTYVWPGECPYWY